MNKTIKKIKKIEKTNSFFWGVFVLCILIIGESVWVMGRFSASKIVPAKVEKTVQKTAKKTAAVIGNKNRVSPEATVFIDGKNNLAVGRPVDLKVFIQGNKTIAVNGIDLVLFYDPAVIEVVDQDDNKPGTQVDLPRTNLGEAARNLVDAEKGRIVISLINLDKKGSVLPKGKAVDLANVRVKPLRAGKANLEIRLATGSRPGTKVSKAGGSLGLAILSKTDYRAEILSSESQYQK